MPHYPWHRERNPLALGQVEGLLTGGPMGLSPEAQLAWGDQLNTNVLDLDTMIRQQARDDIAATPIKTHDVSALVGVDDSPSNVGDAAGAALTGGGQYLSNISKTPECNPMRKRENLGFPFLRGRWSSSV